MDLLAAIEGLWLGKIERAKTVKAKQFGDTADRIWKFYGDANHNFLFKENNEVDSESRIAMPLFPVTCNLTAEYVHMMLPYIHNKAPARRVMPRVHPFLPAEQNPQYQRQFILQKALQYMLDYTPDKHDLRGQCRPAVTESLTKGRGVVWHEFAQDIPGSFFDSVDNLLVDPDSEQLRQASFIVRIRRRPVWAVAEEFGIPRDKLRAAYSSYTKNHPNDFDGDTGDVLDDAKTDPTRPTSADVVMYYEVYSRMGAGHKFVGVGEEMKQASALLDQAGAHVYLAILPGFGGPLNLPKDSLSEATPNSESLAALEWPVRYFGNVIDPWPCTCLDYYVHPRRPWPTSPLEKSLPLQAFMDYAYSFLMARLRSTCRDLICASKGLQTEIRDKLKYGRDQEVIFYDGVSSDLSNLIHVVQFPSVNRDIYEVLRMVEQAFRQSSGLVELMYGASSRAMRSAEEASVMQTNMSIRPEDMADMVEDWHSRIAAKEAAAMRMHVSGETFARCVGGVSTPNSPLSDPFAMAWSQVVNTDDPYDAASEMLYTVDAGTGRKRNLQKEMSDVKEAMSFMFGPSLQNYQMTGNPTLVNGLLQWWGESHQSDATRMLLPDMQMQMQQQMQQQQQQPQQA